MVNTIIPTGNRLPMTFPDVASLCVMVVAGGVGRRFGGEMPKQFLELDGTPVLVHTLRKFEEAGVVGRIVLVLPEERRRWFMENILSHYSFSKLSDVVPGGETRRDSVRHGLECLPPERDSYVAIHDGVRPFFEIRWLSEGLRALREFPAVAVGIPPVDTVKRVSSRGFAVATLKREGLVMIQTPQMFRTDLIKEAHKRAEMEGWPASDDTVLMERMGHPVKILPGSRWNIKITEPSDLELGKVLLRLTEVRGELS